MDAGPFDLKHIIIGAAIVIVTGVAMFLLKGILSVGITIGLWILVIAIVTVAVIIFVLAATIVGYLRFGAEGFLFSKARRNGKAVYIDTELGSQISEFAIVDKTSPKDVVLKDEESGIKVDPSMLDSNAKPMRFPGNLDIYIYTYYNYMPQSISNHAAFKVIKGYFDAECPDLQFLSIKEFIELISDPEHYLERNALVKLNKYFKVAEKHDANGNPVMEMLPNGTQKPKLTFVREFTTEVDDIDPVTNEKVGTHMGIVQQDLDLPELLRHLTKARIDISKLQIPGGLIAGTEAFKYNSVAYSSQHLGHVLMLYEQKIRDAMKGMFDMFTVGLVALMILGGVGICIYIISMAFGKSG